MTTTCDLELSVEQAELIADGVLALTLRAPDGADLPAWDPGAHIDLVLTPDLIRTYSLCGDPADRRTWRIAVLNEPAGRGGSAHVHRELAPGTKVTARGPRNHFPLHPAPRYRFVAGGIGITPLLPMLAAAESVGAEWTLLYGGRTRQSMAYADELTARYGPGRIRIAPHDETGLLDLPAALADPDPDTRVYCCGPTPLLDAVTAHHTANWPPGTLHLERFQPLEQETPLDSFELELARSTRTLTVTPDQSVLEAVRSAGVEVLYSCTEGTCGTCETDVLDGVPDHRDTVLTDAERATNETMMICVSRCKGTRLVLDL
ncbi:ferredoxin [Streptomyces spiroverticillatus]|uniref:Ferredoxin n=1 Tax=Streptomyces finlayi TaxID=67296 RepID=A0A918WVF8_9ACTN|nr:PDR/VanB family oxidoreductase [Streptomyces finlayi]GHA03265.1 ferredoxin [Streptomyces spiroverticillatus]GHC87418.1 ferredoxin [Streptomyces finlayi]